ncbi:hypothetical protein ACFQ3P_19950 [Paraburkholderia sabiae]|jgi:hypothetical protein|uniref:Uncharacterized protein n=2 Tax=Paraburkholderia TaxID=1822464 RepID=A0ABU9RCT1_9BURK|nr:MULTISPECIES: hypothetical protein [Paraburkholderia]WJZ73630.1 hypothetical protein QEN71_26390 [Paraburkholderia sabiae]CAD6541258.1 hypothetical protein LMG24235_03610 [Paraburkholderia sabiae]
MTGLGWIMVILVAILASALFLCVGIAVVIAFLFGTSSRLFTHDRDQ